LAAQEKHVDSARARDLFEYTEELGFPELPDTIYNEPAYCKNPWTDFPIVSTHVFVGEWSKTVVDYHGCVWAPEGLRRLELLIDSLAGTSQWLEMKRRR
jgi:hypothetical protein